MYGVVALLIGGMLEFTSHPGVSGFFAWVLPSGSGPAWDYPALLVGGTSFVLFVPLVSGVFMAATSAGVGIGLAGAIRLAIDLRTASSGSLGRSRLGSPLLGLAPVLLATLTLGACCSTAAVAGAGVVGMARVSGVSTTAVLVNNWYPALFQFAMVYVAILAQDRLIVLFRLLDGRTDPTGRSIPWSSEIPVVVGRAILVATGLVWAVSGLTVTFATPAVDLPVADWMSMVLGHLIPGMAAVVIGVFPHPLVSGLSSLQKRTKVGEGVT